MKNEENEKRLPIEIWGEPQGSENSQNERLYELFERTSEWGFYADHVHAFEGTNEWESVYVISFPEKENTLNVLGPLSPKLVNLSSYETQELSKTPGITVGIFVEPIEGQVVYGYEVTNENVSREPMEGIEWPVGITNGSSRSGKFPEIEALVGYFENEQNFPTLLEKAENAATQQEAENHANELQEQMFEEQRIEWYNTVYGGQNNGRKK